MIEDDGVQASAPNALIGKPAPGSVAISGNQIPDAIWSTLASSTGYSWEMWLQPSEFTQGIVAEIGDGSGLSGGHFFSRIEILGTGMKITGDGIGVTSPAPVFFTPPTSPVHIGYQPPPSFHVVLLHNSH